MVACAFLFSWWFAVTLWFAYCLLGCFNVADLQFSCELFCLVILVLCLLLGVVLILFLLFAYWWFVSVICGGSAVVLFRVMFEFVFRLGLASLVVSGFLVCVAFLLCWFVVVVSVCGLRLV